MIYSVWNQGKSAYDYYQDARTQETLNVERPKHLTSRPLGMTVDQAAWPLPMDASPVGSGTQAIGRVASRRMPGQLAGIDDDGSLLKIGLLLASAALLWKYAVVAKPRRTS